MAEGGGGSSPGIQHSSERILKWWETCHGCRIHRMTDKERGGGEGSNHVSSKQQWDEDDNKGGGGAIRDKISS